MSYVIILSPSKEMNLECLTKKSCDININHFNEILSDLKNVKDFNELKSKDDLNDQISSINVYSKRAIELYNGLAFRQLDKLDDSFYDNVLVLSALYCYSKGSDLISPYRLDYTMKIGRNYRKQNLKCINEYLNQFDVVYNLASNEFAKGVEHNNIVNFEFFVNGKQISAISKKMRGQMVNYIREHGVENFDGFSNEDFIYDNVNSQNRRNVYIK